MPTATETLIARLQADCTAAEQAERSIRATVDAQIKAAQEARAFAWRRLNALSDMAKVAAREEDREAAIEGQLVALFREIGWIENGLAELGEGAQPLIERLRPVAQALHAQAHPAPDDKEEKPAVEIDPLVAFRDFEAWYESERGQPFLQVFERYTPPTPLVEVRILKTDFEQWLAAQFADTGPFTIFIVLVRITDRDVKAVKSSYAQMIGDEMEWTEMLALLEGARTPWDGVAFFVGLGYAGGPLPDALAKEKLKEVEASVLADPLVLNSGRFFDRLGRHMQVDEAL